MNCADTDALQKYQFTAVDNRSQASTAKHKFIEKEGAARSIVPLVEVVVTPR